MQLNEIEDLIMNLKGVLNCRITEDEDNSVREVHIVADESRGAKQISRDVQSVFSATYGISLDYKKISIAQIRGKLKEQNSSKLKVRNFERNISRSKCHVRVILEKDGEEFSGECSGINNFPMCLRKSAEATLLAIENFLGEDGILAIDDIKVVNMSNTQVVVVTMTAFTEERGIEFCGCSSVSDDKYDAAVRAVLNAISPLIERYIDD